MAARPDDAGAEPVLLRDDRGGVTTLTLNRPSRYNALSEALLGALQGALDDVAGDRSVRVVVVAGAGPAFCAGHALDEMRTHHDLDYYRGLFARCSRVMSALVRLPQPTIARVHGLATAAGCQLVAACDLAVASTAARLAVSGVNLGLFCSTPSVALARNVSRKQAFEMLVTGEFIDAETAREYGLVNRVVEPGALDGAVDELARSIAAKAPVAIEIGKQVFYQQLELGLDAAYTLAAEEMARNMMDAQTVEGVDAFLEKRAPRWAHGPDDEGPADG